VPRGFINLTLIIKLINMHVGNSFMPKEDLSVLLDESLVKDAKLFQEFGKLYLERQDRIKKFLNLLNSEEKRAPQKFSEVYNHSRLMELIEHILAMENFEQGFIGSIRDERSNNTLEVAEVSNIKDNIIAIKKFLLEIQSILKQELDFFNNDIEKAVMVNSQIKKELIDLYRKEVEIFNNLKTYYLSIFRTVRDYYKNVIENKPLISVIIPAFNEEKLIARTLASIQRQTYPDKEIIVVDNNSIDKTKDKTAPYANAVYDEMRRTPSFAKNAGANKAKGNILVFVDADCIAPRNLLEGIYQAFIDGYTCGKVIDIRGDTTNFKERFMTKW
jgi:hypothetical protein